MATRDGRCPNPSSIQCYIFKNSFAHQQYQIGKQTKNTFYLKNAEQNIFFFLAGNPKSSTSQNNMAAVWWRDRSTQFET